VVSDFQSSLSASLQPSTPDRVPDRTQETQPLQVLVLDMQPIDPPLGGGRIRLLGLYHALGDLRPTTYVGTYDWRGEPYRHHRLTPNLVEINIPLSDDHFAQAEVWRQRTGGKVVIDAAFNLQAHLSPKFLQTVEQQLAQADVVIFSHPWVYPLVRKRLRDRPQLLIYDAHNVEGLLKTELLDDHGGFGTEIAQNVVRLEYDLCHNADLIVACSETDQQLFSQFYGIQPDKIHLVPNGVFVNQIPMTTAAARSQAKQQLQLADRPTAIFLGSAYDPNVEAVRFILDRVAGALPAVQFIIAGGVGDRFRLGQLEARGLTNVRLTGLLSEAEKLTYLAAADFAINPMFSGSGTNIKMFDFMAAGLPVISTAIGARGIPLAQESPVLRIADADGFVEAIEALLQDGDAIEQMAINARRLVEDQFAWERLSQDLGALIARSYPDFVAIGDGAAIGDDATIGDDAAIGDGAAIAHPLKRRSAGTSLPGVGGRTGDRIAVISTFPPAHCGIGSYAAQLVQYLRDQGNQVTTICVNHEGKADRVLDLKSGLRPLRLLPLLLQYDRVLLNYHRSFFFGRKWDTLWTNLAFILLEILGGRRFTILSHEVERLPRSGSRLIRWGFGLERWRWRMAQHLEFHTQHELDIFLEYYRLPAKAGYSLIPHGSHFTKYTALDTIAARRILGLYQLPKQAMVFVCIGFIQPSKGFDRMVDAFLAVNPPESVFLYVVGSVRVENPIDRQHIEEMKQKAQMSRTINVIEKFVSDEEFDQWISAADYVVLPYRIIWSSSVLERAKLYQKPCLVAAVGGLPEQIGADDFVFDSDEALQRLLSGIVVKSEGSQSEAARFDLPSQVPGLTAL
jgi:glycosyltransferase involved in cell wall biosynthesis